MGVNIPLTYLGRLAAGDAELAFTASSAGWYVAKAGWATPMTRLDAGGLPAGAVSVSLTPGTITQSGCSTPRACNAVWSNGQGGAVPAGRVSLASGQVVIKLATPIIRGNTANISSGMADVTVNFYDAAGAVVATSTFTFQVSAAGSM